MGPFNGIEVGSFGEPRGYLHYMGVSKNRGTPKWMVYNGNLIRIDDLGVPLFSETAISFYMYRIYKHNVSTSQLRLGCPDADKNAKNTSLAIRMYLEKKRLHSILLLNG